MAIQCIDINLLPGGVFCLDKAHNILFWNNEMERLSGFKTSEVIRTKCNFLFLFDESNQALDYLHYLEEKRICSRSVNLKTFFNTVKPVYIQAVLVDAPTLIGTSPEMHMIFLINDLSNIINCEFQLQNYSKPEHYFRNLIGRDKKMLEVYKMIQLASESMANIFIVGESGTGKELIAKAIHDFSERKKGPFMIVNCSSLSESLLESELFGHVKGAFTGAYQEKIGKFEAAHKGTIFLDEIGDISPAIQLKLLRVIQEKTIVRVGSNDEIKVDMRIITATNKNIRQLVEKGEFREDLFYRLKVFSIHSVPLREKPGDIPLLCRHFIENFNVKTGKKIKDLTNDAYRIIMEYYWPGNVRELENAIEHAFVLCESEFIDVFDLPVELRSYNLRNPLNERNAPEATVLKRPIRNYSREEIIQILHKHNWNRTKTALYLGISRVALWKKLKKIGIDNDHD